MYVNVLLKNKHTEHIKSSRSRQVYWLCLFFFGCVSIIWEYCNILQRFVNDYEEDFRMELHYCHEFIERCLEVCWLMCVQDPPVVLNWHAADSDIFDKNMFRYYTKSGSKFDFVVWPAILLHKDGAILSKGIAQPI